MTELSAHKKAFGACWLAFLKLTIPMDIYKSILSKMHSHIIPHMARPIMLMDFLKDSYDAGEKFIHSLGS
jgi:hypothetical protein